MSEDSGLLSQSEIDALLAAISVEGEPSPPVELQPQAPSKAIRNYDFRRPERFSKEQVRALRMIHESWARRISISLSAYLRTSVEVNLSDIDQDAYTSLINHVPDDGVYYIISPLPLPGHVLLHMSLDMAMIIVDRMLGGSGSVLKIQRSLTELEIGLLQSISDRIMTDLQEAWAATASIRPRVDDISLNLLLIPIALPSDAVIWVSFEVRIKDIATGMVLGLPYSVLKPIGARLSPYTWLANAEPDLSGEKSEHQQDVERALTEVKLSLSVLLGSTQLSIEELASLQRGDILMLNTETDAVCPVLINGHVKFFGRPGVQQRKLAVRVEELVEDVGVEHPRWKSMLQEVT